MIVLVTVVFGAVVAISSTLQHQYYYYLYIMIIVNAFFPLPALRVLSRIMKKVNLKVQTL